jgi:dCMP deaminase
MFVVIIGTESSGRRTLQDILKSRFGFKAVRCRGELSQGTFDGLKFKSEEEMLDFITAHWRDNFVTVDIVHGVPLEPFIKRPFCLVIHIDAPILLRYARYKR